MLKACNTNTNDDLLIKYPETADIETSSDDYATRFRGDVGKWMLYTQERGVLNLLRGKVNPPASILDIGGGHGQIAIPLCREGYKVTVIGSAPCCRHRILEIVDSRQCVFDTGNVIDLPYEDNCFDAVVAVRMLTHCTQWEKLVAEMCRVSKGLIITDYPTGQSLNAIAPALFSAKKKYEKNTRTWKLFKHKDIADVFEKHGYAETGRFAQFFLPMVFHRVIKCRPVSATLEGICRCVRLTQLWGTPVIIRMEKTDYLGKCEEARNIK